MLHQHLLAGAVAGVHSANLRQRHMGLVNNEQKILGKIVHQRKGRLARLASRQMPRIVFDAGAIAHLVHHFQIVIGALLQALRLQKLKIMSQIVQALR